MTALAPGDPAAWFDLPTPEGARFRLDVLGGRHLILCFFTSTTEGPATSVLNRVGQEPLFDGSRACFIGICSGNPAPVRDGMDGRPPGVQWVLDPDGVVAKAYGADATSGLPTLLLLDPGLRIRARSDPESAEHLESAVAAMLSDLTLLCAQTAPTPAAPVLVVPTVFEAELCRDLIGLFESREREDSGYMVTDRATGRTVLKRDPLHKRRRDCTIEDDALRDAVRIRIARRLAPEVHKAFQFTATRIERYLIARYDAVEGGYFRPHRDNTTKGTAHRRFAVTINLNAEAYEGGDLRFPEYDRRVYRAATGGAVVFSCSLLHEVTPMVAGRRYCCLPFLYDEAAAEVRRRNASFLADDDLRRSVEASVRP
jgi:predicted 2-oxoglutarate/Fe(II)-dependent dioxygenase YbiX/peroxiredoxin